MMKTTSNYIGSLIDHLLIFKEIAIEDKYHGVQNSIFRFPEIKQNWLGVSKFGNEGHGLGKDFAEKIIKSFNGFYNSFGDENITSKTHIEKLTILNPGIGRDFISDFTTNLIYDYLLTYTETFALKYLNQDQVREFNINSNLTKDSKDGCLKSIGYHIYIWKIEVISSY